MWFCSFFLSFWALPSLFSKKKKSLDQIDISNYIFFVKLDFKFTYHSIKMKEVDITMTILVLSFSLKKEKKNKGGTMILQCFFDISIFD